MQKEGDTIGQLLQSIPGKLKWILLRRKNFKEGGRKEKGVKEGVREGRKVFTYGVDTILTSFRFPRPRLNFRGQT